VLNVFLIFSSSETYWWCVSHRFESPVFTLLTSFQAMMILKPQRRRVSSATSSSSKEILDDILQ